jgi:hypothetical protein
MKFLPLLISLSLIPLLQGESAPDSAALRAKHLGADYGDYSGGEGLSKDAIAELKKVHGAKTLALAGEWRVALDPKNKGILENWPVRVFEDVIHLPGSLAEGGYGEKNTNLSIANLEPKFTYVGPAWYQRDIEVPPDWQGKHISLFLERVMWESRLWIDGHAVGLRDSLCTPHIYDLGELLTPGKHRLTVRVDNSARPSANAHGYGDDIQTRWNGMVGRLDLIARDPVWIEKAEFYPDIKARSFKVRATVCNATGLVYEGGLRVAAKLHGSEISVPPKEIGLRVSGPEAILELTYPLGADARLWDEFDPALYEIEVSLSAKLKDQVLPSLRQPESVSDTTHTLVGLREVAGVGTQLTVNGRKVFLRGTHNGNLFALTGYPATDLESWVRIFKICKSYGLNHMRFHSVTPPQAAFEAADQEGFYIQAELPFWGTLKEGALGTIFQRSELFRILDTYGNNPSFALFTMGNENGGEWPVLGGFVEEAKSRDPRHLFAASSNPYQIPGNNLINPGDQFAATMWGKGKSAERFRYFDDWAQGAKPEPASDFSSIVAAYSVPLISHELGQYWFFPNLKEISEYTGVLQPTGLLLFRDHLTGAGLIDRDADYAMASGKLAVELYKEEMEKQFRTPRNGGFQLLDLRDYPGQNTSLVGILDSFWNSKGIITPDNWKRFCSPTVITANLPKFVWTASETVTAPINVTHYGKESLPSVTPIWRLLDASGQSVTSGRLDSVASVPNSDLTRLGTVTIPCKSISAPAQYTLEAALPGVSTNSWHFWVYPDAPAEEPKTTPGKVLVAEKLGPAVWEKLSEGGTVLLLARDARSAVPVNFVNALWNPWTDSSVKTCGLFIDKKNPALKSFPTENHTDWQWFDILPLTSRAFVLNDLDLPANLTVPIQGIDNPLRAFRLGLLWEASVGKGRLIATSLDLETNLEKRPGARQLRASLLAYAGSAPKKPETELSPAQVEALVNGGVIRPLVGEPAEIADATAKPLLNIKASGKASGKLGLLQPWSQKQDDVITMAPGFGYQVMVKEETRRQERPQCILRTAEGASWQSRELRFKLTCPRNFEGRVVVCLRPPSRKGDAVIIECGRAACYLPEVPNAGKPQFVSQWAQVDLGAAQTSMGEVTIKFYQPMGGTSGVSIQRIIVLQGAH